MTKCGAHFRRICTNQVFIGVKLRNLYIFCLLGRGGIGGTTTRAGWTLSMLDRSGGTWVCHLCTKRASSSLQGMRLNKSVSKSFWELKGWQAPWSGQKLHGFCWCFRWRQRHWKPACGVLFFDALQSIQQAIGTRIHLLTSNQLVKCKPKKEKRNILFISSDYVAPWSPASIFKIHMVKGKPFCYFP